MNSANKARLVERLIEAAFYLIPLLFVGIFFKFNSNPYFLNFNERGIEATLSSAWIGYSFAAAFFLIALPRNKYTEKIEKKGLLLKYAIIVMSPALFGTIHMLSIVFTSALPSRSSLSISAFLFYTTIAYAIYSISILLRILFLSSHKK